VQDGFFEALHLSRASVFFLPMQKEIWRTVAMPAKVIFLVEDNPDDQALAVMALRKNHVANDVVTADDGVKAIDYLFSPASLAYPPALVLLDLKLPRMDGMEVLRRIRADARTRRLPVVALTSSREDRDLTDLYNLGVNSYVCKPVDFNKFIESVRQLGLYWLVLNEPPPGN
jgi:two-component system, response regulator